jgi:hypothetical protein
VAVCAHLRADAASVAPAGPLAAAGAEAEEEAAAAVELEREAQQKAWARAAKDLPG